MRGARLTLLDSDMNPVMTSRSKTLVAEGLGTMLLLAAIVGSGIMGEPSEWKECRDRSFG
jgi:hypothetical protein